MSEKIKAWAPNIYPHLVKTKDRHYSAGGIASDAQRYLDRGIKTDITTTAETTVLMASQPTHSDKSHSLERDKILADVPLQLLDLNKQLRQTHRRNPSIVDWNNRTGSPSNMKHNRAQRSAGQPSQQAICKNFLRGRACFKGNRCAYFHPPHAQAHIATTDTGLPGTDSDQHNYEHAMHFDERKLPAWQVRALLNLATTLKDLTVLFLPSVRKTEKFKWSQISREPSTRF